MIDQATRSNINLSYYYDYCFYYYSVLLLLLPLLLLRRGYYSVRSSSFPAAQKAPCKELVSSPPRLTKHSINHVNWTLI